MDCVQEDGPSQHQSMRLEDNENSSAYARRIPEGTLIIHIVETIQEKLVKRSFRFLSRPLVLIINKLYQLICLVPFEYWRRQHNVYPSSALENKPDGPPPGGAEAVNEVDQVLPCVERLQRVEKLLVELNNKPVEIPVEKEQMLQQSMNRIKSVECDLEKTKRVLHATVVKQLEIADLLETMRESGFRMVFLSLNMLQGGAFFKPRNLAQSTLSSRTTL